MQGKTKRTAKIECVRADYTACLVWEYVSIPMKELLGTANVLSRSGNGTDLKADQRGSIPQVMKII